MILKVVGKNFGHLLVEDRQRRKRILTNEGGISVTSMRGKFYKVCLGKVSEGSDFGRKKLRKE